MTGTSLSPTAPTARPTTWAAGDSPPGQRVIFTNGTALTEKQIKNLQITQPNGPAILAFGVPAFPDC